jgi:protein-tyrosine phosphatase
VAAHGRIAFVDVHSHVVPSGDDGAATVEEGLELCRIAFESGTRVLFATPHAHAPWDTYPLTPARERLFRQAFPVVRDRAAEWGLDLRPGWELFPTELADADPAEWRLGGTDAVLVEFPGSWLDFTGPVEEVVAAGERIEGAGLVPVLAHPERCPAITAAPERAGELAARGWLLCLNGPSVLGGHGRAAEATAWRLLEAGVVALVASDGHTRRRPPRLDEAFAAVAARLGAAAAAPLFDGSALPWHGRGDRRRGEDERAQTA